ncbi:MAG TPA: PPE family protein [Mycobacterium sp.]|nr:PPE family protein [Mycobacterium sp.]HTQ21480.1 PPE family protein [Mycobacterium sp.]
MTIDFGTFPPEINSGRMYAGLGSGPMLAAAAAWDALAAELHSAAAAYASVVSGLTVTWRGAASTTMAAAAVPYAAWVSTTAEQAERTAVQARAAAAAYEAAFTATVPPTVVAANRLQLSVLLATNFFGQNTPAIMATQADYIEMWAQDAAAMYGYASSSAAASQVTPFNPPPQIANPAGLPAQANAVANATAAGAGQTQGLPQLMSVVPGSLQSMAAPASSAAAQAAADPSAPASLASSLNTLLGFAAGPVSPLSYFGVAGVPELLGAQCYLLPQAGANLAAAANAPTAPSAGSGAVLVGGAEGGARTALAGAGRAGIIGGLSVPQGWAVSAPAVKSAAAVMQTGSAAAIAEAAPQGEATLFGNMALSSMAGRAIAGTGESAARSTGVMAGAAGKNAGPVNIFIVPSAPQRPP